MEISNNDIKKIKSLSSKKYRDKLGLFTVEGQKMVDELIAINSQKSTSGNKFNIDRIYRKDEIGEKAMSRITALNSPSPILAVVRKPNNILLESDEEICEALGNSGLYLALDSLRDPGNMGTILRLAEWFGIDTIFASPDSVDIFNPKVVQATMGAIFRVKFHYVDIAQLCKKCRELNGKVYGTFLDGEDMYSKDLSNGSSCPVVVITGNEARGISNEVAEYVSDKLYIPSYPRENTGSESLNAAIATAVTISEFRRRVL